MTRYFLAYLTSFVAVAPLDPRVASRTNKFFNMAVHMLAGVQDTGKDLSVSRQGHCLVTVVSACP